MDHVTASKPSSAWRTPAGSGSPLYMSPAMFGASSAFAGSRRAFDDAVALLGVEERNFAGTLTVHSHSISLLSSEDGQASAVRPVKISTQNVDTYKAWVGTGDDECPAGSAIARWWPLPGKPWGRRNVSHISELTTEERDDLQKAGWAYIFGNSKLVQSYRHVIEQFHAPFEAAVYPLRKLTLQPEGRLIVTGAPAVLLFADVEIHASGRLVTHAVCKASFGRLQKLDQAYPSHMSR